MSEITVLKDKLLEAIENDRTKYRNYEDLFAVLRELEGEDHKEAHAESECLRRMLTQMIPVVNNPEKWFDLYKKTLLFDAKDSFDCYLLYLEIDRRPQERFYQPRRKILKKAVDAMQRLVDGELDELFISMPPRVGKSLANDTPILTRNGWKNHGDLVVGDEVIGMDGRFKKVLAVHPKCMLDRMVEFTNGEKIQCHARHEWLLFDRARGETALKETQDYESRKLEYGGTGRGHRYVLQVPAREPIIGEEKKLPLDPYTFGVWLGDGSNTQPRICNDRRDRAVINRIIANGYKPTFQYTHKTTGVDYYDFPIRSALRSMGMCHSKQRTEKYIPDEYLTASLEQRLQLLAGLLDTDGSTCEKQYTYTTCDEQLRDSVCSLISTFGWRVYVVKYEPRVSSSGVCGKKPYYVVKFTADRVIPCALERKIITDFGIQRKIALKSISIVEPKEGNCITVEGGMYLAGRTMIPTHNTTLLMFLVTWLIGRDSEKSNLYSAYSDFITSAFYNGVLEVLTDPITYKWGDVFQETISNKNAQLETLDIGRRKRYPAITCRSLYGTLNGACDCSGFLISDDLIGGIEEALNKDRLVAAWSKVDNNLIPRAKESAKILWVGTRWSVADPAGVRMDMLENAPEFRGRRYEVINLPALDENDESNFDYDYGVGFSTDFYRQRRASFEHNNDMASWTAQYMGEPIEREGTLFTPDSLQYFNGVLPDREPDRKFMAVDPAFGGGDFTSGPIAYQYGEDIYIVDVVFSNEDKSKTQPEIASKAVKWGLQSLQIEANKSTMSYKEGVESLLKERGYRLTMTTKPASPTTTKEQRIFDKAPDIRERCIFLEPSKRSKEYNIFMQNIFSFKISGRNKHDDAPDSMAMLMDMVLKPSGMYSIFKRPF